MTTAKFLEETSLEADLEIVVFFLLSAVYSVSGLRLIEEVSSEPMDGDLFYSLVLSLI